MWILLLLFSTVGSASNGNSLASITGYTIGYAGGASNVAGWSVASGGGGGGGAGTSGSAASSSTNRPGNGGDGIYQVTFGGVTSTLATLFGSAYTSIADLQNGNFYIGSARFRRDHFV